MRNLSMKKFGTPMRAGPGVDSEKVGLAGVGRAVGVRGPLGGLLHLVARAPHARAQGAVLPVDGALVAGVDRRQLGRAGVAARVAASAAAAVVAAGRRAGGGQIDLGHVDVGQVDFGDVDRRGRRLGSRGLDRAEVDDVLDGRRQTGDLHLLDRRTGRDVDREREGLTRHERHLDAVQRGGCGRDENHRVQGGAGGRDRQQLTTGHPRAGSPPAAPAESRHPASAGRGTL